MRFILVLLFGKLLTKIGKLTGKGTNLPGELALKLYPDLLARFTFKGKIIAITGSNGKTTTTNMLANILSVAGYKVASNQKGSNLTGGITTTIISNANLHGYVDADFVVLEVDERYSRLIFKHFSPDYLLCTNLFRDQLTRNGNIDVIIDKLDQAIKPSVKLILNANDPISSNLVMENERVYFGLAHTSLSSLTSFNITHDAKVCPRCYHKLDYEYFHYNHIGKYHCSNCGYQTPPIAYLADHVDFTTGNFMINGFITNTTFKSLFNFLNVTAAVAAACELGVDIKTATEIASNFNIMEQRYKEFTINERPALMILSKNQNPVSYDQSIAYILSVKGPKTLVIVVNNINHTYEKDTTWLYDISFERLIGHVDYIICSGQRAYDLAVRLKLAGFTSDQLIIDAQTNMLKSKITKTTGTLCFLTEVYDAQAVLNAVK